MIRRRVRACVSSAALAGLLLAPLGACSQIRDQVDGARLASGPLAVEYADPVLTTVDWAVSDGMASLLVRNDTQSTLRRADVLATAVDADGLALASSASMAFQSRCCRAHELPPGATFGFYFYVGEQQDAVTDVVVTYRNLAWSRADDSPAPLAVGEPVGMTTDEFGAVAVADITVLGSVPIPVTVVQAVLTDADGDLRAVVSGVWKCTAPGTARIRLQLFHPVPAGTVVSAVSAFPELPPDTGLEDPAKPACQE